MARVSLNLKEGKYTCKDARKFRYCICLAKIRTLRRLYLILQKSKEALCIQITVTGMLLVVELQRDR